MPPTQNSIRSHRLWFMLFTGQRSLNYMHTKPVDAYLTTRHGTKATLENEKSKGVLLALQTLFSS